MHTLPSADRWPQLCGGEQNAVMIEKQNINGKDVWLKIDPYHVERENPNIIPTEYFTATYYIEEPSDEKIKGVVISEDDETRPRLFESPVAAMSYVWKKLRSVGVAKV